MKTAKPTPEQFAAYVAAFDYFNVALFAGRLPGVILNFSRKAGTAGFFAPERWHASKGEGDATHEISLNPELLTRPPIDTAATLVHEMVHLRQQVEGKPSRSGYHNREWVEMMRAVGLEPKSLDSENGTGQRVSHEVIPGGAFAVAFDRMPDKARALPFVCVAEGRDQEKKRERKAKTSYECPGCGAKVWGKPGMSIRCEDCDEAFEEAAADQGAED